MLMGMSTDLQAIADLVLTDEELRAVEKNGSIVRYTGTISVEGSLVRVHSEIGLSPMDYERMLRICQEVYTRRGQFFLMAVAGPNTPSMGPEQRKLIGKWSKQYPAAGVAIVSPQTGLLQTMTTLLIRGISMLGARTIPLAFFRQETEARVWISNLRFSSASRPRP